MYLIFGKYIKSVEGLYRGKGGLEGVGFGFTYVGPLIYRRVQGI